MATLADLEVRISADLASLRSTLARAESEVRSFASRAGSSVERFSAAFGKVQAAIAAVGLLDVAQRVMDATAAFAAFQDTANRTGLSTAQVQEFAYAVQLSGGEAEEAGGALEKFAINTSKAAQGVGPLARILQANGVALKDSTGALRPLADLLGQVANLVQGATSEQDKLNIASAAFGKAAGPAVVMALSEGASGLSRFAQEARAAGAVVQSDVIDKASDLDDAFDRMKLSLAAVGQSLAVEFGGPVVKSAMEYLLASLREIAGLVNAIKGMDLAGLGNFVMSRTGPGALYNALGLGQGNPAAELSDLTRQADDLRGRIANLSSLPAGDPGRLPIDYLNAQLAQMQTRIEQINATPLNVGDHPAITINKPTGARKPTIVPQVGGGSSGNKRTSADRFNDDLQDIRDRTAALQQEAATIGQTYAMQEQRRIALQLEQQALADLRTEAEKKGITDTSSITLSQQQRDRINEVAAAYGNQANALKMVQEKQQQAEQAANEFYGAFKSGIISAIQGTKSFGQAISELVAKLGDMLLNSAFNGLFQPGSGGTGGGLFGGLFSGAGSLFGGARAGGGSVAGSKAYLVGEKGPEFFMPGRSGMIVPNSISMPSFAMPNAANGNAMSFNFSPVYNVTGNGEDIAQLKRQMARDKAEFHSNVVSSVRRGKSSRALR